MTDSVGLPGGWTRAKLGDVLPIRYGKGLTESKRKENGDVPVYGSSGVVGTHDEALTCGPALIVGRKGSVGSVHRSSRACWPIDTVYYAEEAQDTPLGYYEHLLAHLRLGRLDRSTTIPGLSRDDYDEVVAPIAPLPEQHRIVEAIESYLTRLDNAVALLERVEENLKRYRASVLKAAVEGRLLPEGSPREPFRERNWQRVDSAILALDQGWSPRCDAEPASAPGDWGVIKTTAVQRLAFVKSANKRLPGSLKPRPHLELVAGDLLVTRAGPKSRVGICALVRSTRPRLMLCDKVYRLRCNPAVASSGYLELVLNAPQVVAAIDDLKTGISDSGVNLTQRRFGELLVPLPAVRVQEQIEAAVRLAWSQGDAVALTAGMAARRLCSLRHAILKRAFEGKLVEQDPSDEPASVLLERIKAERAATSAGVSRARKRRSAE